MDSQQPSHCEFNLLPLGQMFYLPRGGTRRYEVILHPISLYNTRSCSREWYFSTIHKRYEVIYSISYWRLKQNVIWLAAFWRPLSLSFTDGDNSDEVDLCTFSYLLLFLFTAALPNIKATVCLCNTFMRTFDWNKMCENV